MQPSSLTGKRSRDAIALKTILIPPLTVLLSPCACTDDGPLPIEYQSEYFRIGANINHPLCEGDLRRFDQLANYVSEELKFESSSVTDVYVWGNALWWEQAPLWCGSETAFGCYVHKDRAIYTSETALEHELIHATVNRPNIHPFLSEGIAEVFSGRQSRFAQSLPSSNIDTTTYTTDLLTAGHFTHWLLQEWNSEMLGSASRLHGQDFFNEFESVFGITFEQAESKYLTEAPAAYPALHSCDPPELDFDPNSRTWSVRAEIACEDTTTQANHRGLYTSRVLSIEEDGYYNFHLPGGWAEIYMCTPAPVEVLTDFEDYSEYEILPDHITYPDGFAHYIDGPSIRTLALHPGQYLVRAGVDDFAPGKVEVGVWLSLSFPRGTP